MSLKYRCFSLLSFSFYFLFFVDLWYHVALTYTSHSIWSSVYTTMQPVKTSVFFLVWLDFTQLTFVLLFLCVSNIPKKDQRKNSKHGMQLKDAFMIRSAPYSQPQSHKTNSTIHWDTVLWINVQYMDLVDNIRMSTSVIGFFWAFRSLLRYRTKTGIMDICETGRSVCQYFKVKHQETKAWS